MKKRVMIFCDFYLPGYKSGGGMWTIVNLIEHFRESYDFYVVTRNYDSKGDTEPYTTIKTDGWNEVGYASVYYFSKKSFNRKKFAQLVAEIAPDAFFLNSAFALPVIKFLSARRRQFFADKPIILAPCGEFSDGAMSVKSSKKKLFMSYAKLTKLYENVVWKASFESEKREIVNLLGENIKIMVAPDLAPREILPEYSDQWKTPKESGDLKLVFLSRIVRKKNIRFLLETLMRIKKDRVILEIIGPVEDRNYWTECVAVIEKLPSNVSVRLLGAMRQTDALRRVAENHFFVLPTLNENFGYAFIEAMAAGCPVLTTDRTAWNDLENRNAGWQIPLENPEKWIEKINYCLAMSAAEYTVKSQAARNYAAEWIADNSTFEANRRVFETVLSSAAHS